MADQADSVQPGEGQGGQAADSPYADYLNRIPEEVRGEVEPIFKEWDSNTTKRFQEASEYRRQWEPFEQLGINQQNPDEVRWALEMLDAAKTNPQAVKEWFDGYAAENGLTAAEQQQLENEYTDPAIQQIIEQQLSARLGPVSQGLEELSAWRQQQEQQRAHDAAMTEIKSAMDEIKAEHPAEFDEKIIERFLAPHIESATDPRAAVRSAWDDWSAVRNQVVKDALQGKVDGPPPPESGGTADGTAPQIRTLAEAKEAALQQLRAQNTT